MPTNYCKYAVNISHRVNVLYVYTYTYTMHLYPVALLLR